MENINKIIDDEKLEELYSKLRPVVTVNGAKYLLKKYVLEEIKHEAYLSHKKSDKETYLDNSEIKVVGSFDYIREYSNPLSFEPTIGEILSEIPQIYQETANAFEISETPRICGDKHLAKVMTYKIHQK